MLYLTHSPHFTARPPFTVTAGWAKRNQNPLLLAAASKIAAVKAGGGDGVAEQAEYNALLLAHHAASVAKSVRKAAERLSKT